MANTLTDLIPDIYQSLDTVSRELVGFVPAVTRDTGVERAQVGQSVRSFVAPAATATDITPSNVVPDDGDQTIGNVELTIAKSRRVPIRWNGEEQLGLNTGAGTMNVLNNQFQQAFRTLSNEMEADLAALHINASRAYGAAGTTPLGTAGDYTDISNTIKILKDNGAPLSDIQCVLNTAAGASLTGKQSRVDFQGNESMLRQGVLLDHMGAEIRESGQVKTFTAGTGASATTNTAGYAIGATTITLASAGTGTILAGDVITFAGDTNKYVVKTGDADVSGGGSIVLNGEGLVQAIPASATAITVVATSARNMVFSRSAIVLANRLPARPMNGDTATDVVSIQDPHSGLVFEIAEYKQYRQTTYEVSAAWGANMVKEAHTAVLLG